MQDQYKTLLIPIDFTIESLNTVKHALAKHSAESINVLLLHSRHLSDSIPELLFYSKYDEMENLRTPAFEEALTILKNRFESNIKLLIIDVFHGFTAAAYASFAESRKVHVAYVPKSYSLKTEGNSFNPVPLIKRSGLPYIEVEWSITDQVNEQERLNTLFNRTVETIDPPSTHSNIESFIESSHS